ncbi:P-loop containing nucleoside triphosphate hydrolase protein [Dendrothele bispora CBS 962.96]|uniref:P-loop containing nucleoside triphosphate hydrolase protein n=1 Tax=Dendrothele bispora (strain CBS 962.96) TaxID=1314807 RepID=A0A4S8LDN8_DENBC|nr:P-loop containing nucleoside triphosphate hydrolase protein [Dendrothele bispora CBS 962.96]
MTFTPRQILVPEIPAYVALISASLFLLHALSKFVSKWSSSRQDQQLLNEDSPTSFDSHDPEQDQQQKLPKIILASRVLKLLGCLAMFGLTIATAVEGKCGSVAVETETEGSGDIRHVRRAVLLTCLLFAYTFCLSTISLLPSKTISHEWKDVCRKHLEIVLLVPLGIYVYRDIFPLGTYTLEPVDACEGNYLWTKISMLVFIAIVLPLFTPREYVPVDPKNPRPVNPEQTCSIFSLTCFTFMDNVIFAARSVEHLAYDQLPVLGDWDYASTLRKQKFKYLDTFSGAPKCKLIWGLIQSFWPAYLQMAIFMGPIKALSNVLSPVALNQLLKYMESGGEDAMVRPWVWILGLFSSPILEAVSYEWFYRVVFHTEVRIEALVQQLVFEHALRMRVKNEVFLSSASEEPGGGNTTNSKKDKGKEKDADKDASNNQNVHGKINNLVTSDLQNMSELVNVFVGLGDVPLELILYAIFLYSILGWSALVGIVLAVLLSPIPTYLTKLGAKVQSRKMKKTDSRVQTFSDTVNVLRMVKLFGWEGRMSRLIGEKREEELKFVRWKMGLDLGTNIGNLVISFVTMATTFAVHSLIRKQGLTASVVFSSIAVFDTFGLYTRYLSMTVNLAISAIISMNRITEFLQETELIDDYHEEKDKASVTAFRPTPDRMNDIGFCNATFTWSKDSAGASQPGANIDGSSTPTPSHGRRRFLLQVKDEVFFKQDHLNLIVGPTGSGKTALLLGLLGEMHFVPPLDGEPTSSWVNLPRDHGIAYAPQESWVLNRTIKDNIVFNSEFDEVRYRRVLYQCALERDLSLFKAGDETEVGEKGQTLSGGQKARLTLARAVYSKAQIVILDDVLAALDVHTSKWVVEKCLAGDLLEGRTVIMVTHNVDLVKPLARYIVTMKDGRVVDQDHVSKAHQSGRELIMKLRKENDEHDVPKPENADEQKAKDGKLVMDEEIAVGHVGLSAVRLYASGLSGGHITLFFSLFFIGLSLATLTTAFQTWYLGYWASQYELHAPEDIPVLHYFGNYGLLFLLIIILTVLSQSYFIYGAVRASRSLHQLLVKSITTATFGWLDKTPVSRIITRITQDINTIDDGLPRTTRRMFEMTTSLVIKLGAIVLFTPVFLIPGVLSLAIGYWLGSLYLRAQMSVRREVSNKKAPVLGHLGHALHGLVSIRAYGVQSTFKTQLQQYIDQYSRAARVFYNMQRWIAFRLPVISGTFISLLAAYLLYVSKQSASTTGFSLNMAVSFTIMLFMWMVVISNFEAQSMSIERIDHYLKIEHEPGSTEGGCPPAYWPASGDLRVENLSARYSPEGPEVLHGLFFHVKSGERIGVVGRTGSGKSTLTLSLLRCIYNTGNIFYDGLSVTSMNLDSLRANITIIPQMPELVGGTLRQNLDPFSEHDDFTLNNALRSAGLSALQEDMAEEDKITLDTAVSGGGNNFSLGQRQIVALARAIVRRSKLLLLDEATSAIDYKTDNIIQKSLRTELGGDVTLITIAHRLQTIMDADRIMVLDSGNIVEFGAPKSLLKDKTGLLRALVDESHDKDTLMAMAGL